MKKLSIQEQGVLYSKGIVRTNGTYDRPRNVDISELSFRHGEGDVEKAEIKYDNNEREYVVFPRMYRDNTKKK